MASKGPNKAKIIFTDGKVGRHSGVEPLEITDPKDPDAVIRQVLRFVQRRHLLASSYPDVWLMADTGTGGIDAGFRTVATFRIEPLEPVS